MQKYNIDKKELTSKLEARNEIDKIITEHNDYYKTTKQEEKC